EYFGKRETKYDEYNNTTKIIWHNEKNEVISSHISEYNKKGQWIYSAKYEQNEIAYEMKIKYNIFGSKETYVRFNSESDFKKSKNSLSSSKPKNEIIEYHNNGVLKRQSNDEVDQYYDDKGRLLEKKSYR